MAQNLLTEKTNKALISMSVPISLGMVSTILFQIVDTYFVGQLGAVELAALSFSATVYFLLVGLFIGLAVGVSIIIGTSFGEGDHTYVRQATTVSLIIAFGLGMTFAVLGPLTLEPVFAGLGADERTLPHIAAYMIPLYLGMPLLAVGIVAGAVPRAIGIIKPAEIIFGIAGVINAALDYVLIKGLGPIPALGIKGVAIGTVTSWLFILILMIILLRKHHLLTWSVFKEKSVSFSIVRRTIRFGLPSILTQLITPVTLMYLTFLLGREASEAVAAFGVSGRIETLLTIGIMAISTAAVPFIAQNLGARHHLRIDEAIVFLGKAASYLGLVVVAVLMAFAGPIAGLFSDNTDVIEYTEIYFYIVSFSYIFYGLYQITAAIFNGLQLPAVSLKILLVKTLVFMIPLTIAGTFFGINGIFGGLALSNVLGGAYAAVVMRKYLKNVKSTLVGRNPLKDYKADISALGAGIARVFGR